MYVQVPQVMSNLIFSYSGGDLTPPVPVLQPMHLKGVQKDVASEN